MAEWRDNLSEAEELCEEGIRLLEEGSYDQAGDCFERAVELAPDYPDALFHLGNYYMEMDRAPEAIGLLRRASSYEPDNGELKLALGEAYLQEERPAMAVAALTEALR